MTCLPGFVVPVVDDVADLPVDGSIPLAVFKPTFGLSPHSDSSALWDSGVQWTGLKQLLLVWHGVPFNGAGATLGHKVWANNSMVDTDVPTLINLPLGWAPIDQVKPHDYYSVGGEYQIGQRTS